MNLKFRRQAPVGNYIADFVCHSLKIIIELDGSQYMSNQVYDEQRTLFLESQGFRVIRFWNNDVLNKTSSVLDSIALVISKKENKPRVEK